MRRSTVATMGGITGLLATAALLAVATSASCLAAEVATEVPAETLPRPIKVPLPPVKPTTGLPSPSSVKSTLPHLAPRPPEEEATTVPTALPLVAPAPGVAPVQPAIVAPGTPPSAAPTPIPPATIPAPAEPVAKTQSIAPASPPAIEKPPEKPHSGPCIFGWFFC